ncbi:hypothetical protein BOTBODRAFT_106538 [Botryobasidium botryosum FD-172 SS1]|uniref:UBR-type domain-containing protein n=1 Tax=Botryobasidium botryosum (strain FD-172 SS1) TaxID=930990 RepID=A0A067MZD0_BOTB1|nr:hypothetical protein BOTBODRAFT_106538 [Botryobasidium botryosum FD-172 SS1]
MASLRSIIEAEDALIQEAALALPHQFTTCTYSLRHIRQAVHLCLTCALPRGFCSACSIACHGDHEQIELFPKRAFRCDCPTTSLPHACTLHTTATEPENADNTYGQNFKGLFCRCGRTYDASTERETMVQCVACEDWFHESCLNLRERPPPFSAEPAESAQPSEPEPAPQSQPTAATWSDDGLPPALLPGSAYDSFICGSCVVAHPVLRKWAGSPGCRMVIAKNGEHDGAGHAQCGEPRTSESESPASLKRALSPSLDNNLAAHSPPRKRVRSVALCSAPPPDPVAQQILSAIAPAMAAIGGKRDGDGGVEETIVSLGIYKGAGDLFLSAGWRDRWCKCDSCLPSLENTPYLLVEEDTYEPPEDPDSGLSLEELGMRALQSLPREKTLDSIRVFNELRDDLLQYLRPFAAEGRIVSEDDVKGFFESKRAAKR